MNSLVKYIDFKLVSILFLVIGFLLIWESNAHARFVKKIGVEPFLNPKDWQKLYDPGLAFTLMLENSLAESDSFQVMRPPKRITKKGLSNLFKSSEVNKEINPELAKERTKGEVDSKNQSASQQIPLSQYQVRGRILSFDPDTNPKKEGDSTKGAFRHQEMAKIEAVIELINLRTGRALAKKTFVFTSNTGRTKFNVELSAYEYDSLEFKSSSIGKAFWDLNNSVKVFVTQALDGVPLVGDLISMENTNKITIINLGKANGIKLQDIFIVFSMQTSFTDPLNQTDLGDQYTRKGIIKIMEVQGRFSRAEIMVGQDLLPGDLVVPKLEISKQFESEAQLPNKSIIWGEYKDLSSLSY